MQAQPGGEATPLGWSALYGAAALLVASTLLLPGWHPAVPAAIGVVTVVLALLGATVLVVGMSRWLAHALVATGSLLVGIAMLAGGGGATTAVYSGLVFWVVLQAVLLLPPWQAAGHVLLTTAVLSTALVLVGDGDRAAAQVLLTMATAVLVAVTLRVVLSRAWVTAGQDELTELPNRRGLGRVLDVEFARFRRSGRPLTVLVLDLDGFKSVNDSYGHAAGDAVLVGVGRAWGAQLRVEDTLARVGGDEFVAVLTDTDAEAARSVVDRLVGSTSSELRVSIGVATATSTDIGPAGLVARADNAMYQQKASRRRGPEVPPAAVGHNVHFFDGTPALLERLGPFVQSGLDAGEVCIVVATAEHRAALRRRLGPRLDAARKTGQYVELDAEETLRGLIRDGVPDQARFDAIVGELISSCAADQPLRVFGEMVALLWARDDVLAALALEDVWNELGDREEFSLLCAYPSDGDTIDRDGFVQICTRHDAVSRGTG